MFDQSVGHTVWNYIKVGHDDHVGIHSVMTGRLPVY